MAVKFESLEEFKNRVYPFSENSIYSIDKLITHENLAKKVDENGKMKKFIGNTTVFMLDEKGNDNIKKIQDVLYKYCDNMLAEKLHTSTFHMTLHDLENGEPHETGINEIIESSCEKAREKLEEIKSLNLDLINMKSTWTFKMMDTSIVLGLEPCSEIDCYNLKWLNNEFQKIKYLPYPQTPHITLAYFKTGIYGVEDVINLKNAFEEINSLEKLFFTFDPNKLLHQKFDDMNNYYIY